MRTKSKVVKDDFLTLVRRFPLRPIRSHAQLAEAVAVLISLDARVRRTTDEEDYANTLSLLVKEYEIPRPLPALTVIQRLRHLMTETGLNVSGLGKIIGSQPEASMVLAGARELSKEHVRRLSAHFKLSPEYFL